MILLWTLQIRFAESDRFPAQLSQTRVMWEKLFRFFSKNFSVAELHVAICCPVGIAALSQHCRTRPEREQSFRSLRRWQQNTVDVRRGRF